MHRYPGGVGQGSVLAASAVIVDSDSRVLLIKRGHEPAKNLWSLPGGSVEEGENLVGAVIREVFEETGLRVVAGKEVWQVRVELSAGRFYDVHAFSATVMGGELVAGDDAEDAKWWHVDELSQLDLTPHLLEFLVDYTKSLPAN